MDNKSIKVFLCNKSPEIVINNESYLDISRIYFNGSSIISPVSLMQLKQKKFHVMISDRCKIKLGRQVDKYINYGWILINGIHSPKNYLCFGSPPKWYAAKEEVLDIIMDKIKLYKSYMEKQQHGIELLDNDKHPDDFKCPICCDIFTNPVITECNHTFCDKCIRRWGIQNSCCPLCRSNVVNNIYRIDYPYEIENMNPMTENIRTFISNYQTYDIVNNSGQLFAFNVITDTIMNDKINNHYGFINIASRCRNSLLKSLDINKELYNKYITMYNILSK